MPRRATRRWRNLLPQPSHSLNGFIFPKPNISADCDDYAPHGNLLAERIPESKDCEPLASYSALTPKNIPRSNVPLDNPTTLSRDTSFKQTRQNTFYEN